MGGTGSGWFNAGKEAPEGWKKPKWQHLPTRTIRVSTLIAEALLKVGFQADASPDPIAYLESLRPGGAPPAPTAPPPPVDGDITAMNVAQLRKLAAARGMTGAARANKSALLEFLS